MGLEKVTPRDALHLVGLSLGEGSVPRSEEFWQWKHLDNPFGASLGLAAVAQGQVVGLRIFMRWTWETSSQPYQAVRAVDTAVHPEWRRRGLFRRLTERLAEQATREKVHFIFNTPNASSKPGYLKMGWQEVGRIPLLIRTRNPIRMALRRLFPRPQRPAIQSRLADSHGRGPEPPEPLALAPVDELLQAPELKRFLDAVRDKEKRFYTWRAPTYLRWRYVKVPGLRYGALWEIHHGSGAALIVRRRTRQGLDEMSLSEVLVTPDRAGLKSAASLLGRVLSCRDTDYVTACASPGSVERGALKAAGFKQARFVAPRLTVRPLNLAQGTLSPTAAASWRFSIGDLEVF